MTKPRRLLLLWLPIILMAAGWIIYYGLGATLSASIAVYADQWLQRAAGGKIINVVEFVDGRLREMLLLGSTASVLLLIIHQIWKISNSRTSISDLRGIIMGISMFASINLMAWVAASTVVFWSLFYDKQHVDNFAQYQIKRILFKEIGSRNRMVLMGNSQANRAIDEVLLNSLGGNFAWTTDFTQPGARGLDMLALSRDLSLRKGDTIVCYMSEISFYGSGSSTVISKFLGFPEIETILKLNGSDLVNKGVLKSGIAGNIIPLYRYRDSISAKLLGYDLANIEQVRFEKFVSKNLAHLAADWGPRFQLGRNTDFEQAAFSMMIEELINQDCTVILISAHLHPELLKHIPDPIRGNFSKYLQDQKKIDSQNVTIIKGEELMVTSSGDYVDLVHLSADAQRRFSITLLHYLTAVMEKPTTLSKFPEYVR